MTLRDELNSLMTIGRVVHVHADGTVTGAPGIHAPECYCAVLADGSVTDAAERDMMSEAQSEGWTIESGWTGQYGYRGALMHPSEFIGGCLADHILETPGYWVALVPSFSDDSDDAWVLAYRETGA